jgi:hypothetical protein
MPVLKLGPRKQEVAYAVVHTLKTMLAPGCTPAFTSDGLMAYYYPLTAHFGHWQESPDGGKPQWVVSPDLVYAQLKKIRSWRRLVGTEQRMLCGTREMLTERLHACNLRATIQTAFVERVNLTLRQRCTHRRSGQASPPKHGLVVTVGWCRNCCSIRCQRGKPM